ncbi:MAG: hypothetical protein Q8O76_11685, partial [Chloroflexota bacterium]|nr:hypothetical protein [Chloroflexota bacterium]
MELKSRRVEVDDALEAIELFFERRWSDGLPIVPPTPDKVEEMIRYAGRDPREELGSVPPRYGVATIEKLAINSVMAGCLPQYFPVVIAAVEAMLEPRFNLNGIQTTTHCNEPLLIVNGPIVKELGINAGDSVFGGGFRANATIGRASKLILWNLGQSYPSETDKSTFSHPGRFSFCIAENEEASPWEPLHVERGLPPGSSAVTVFACEAPHSILSSGPAETVLRTVWHSMATLGNNNIDLGGETLVLISARNAAQFEREGWSKQRVKQYIWEKARLPRALVASAGLFPGRLKTEEIALTKGPEDIHVVVAGGFGQFCACCPGWGDLGGFAITKEIKVPAPK